MEVTQTVDLTNCDREPIHIPGYIQSHGFLIAIDPDTLMIEKVSDNIGSYTSKKPVEVLGQHVNAMEQIIKTERKKSSFGELIKLGQITGNFEQLNPQKVMVNGTAMFLISHIHNGKLICEFESIQSDEDNITLQRLMATALAVIQSSSSFDKLLDHVARLVKEISGYNRIMVYKFHNDQHGEVIAEAKDEELETWLHLHYPASDIPAQARELYKLNMVRIIADINGKNAGIVSNEKKPVPLDLTHSTLRAVSPIHIEYLKNMEVGASFSISLISKNELWGLIACHNTKPRFIDYNSRTACKFIGQIFSAALEFKNNEGNEKKVNEFAHNQQVLFENLMKEADPVEALTRKPVTLLDVNSATGVVFCYEGQRYQLGKVPGDDEISTIVNHLRKNENGSFYQTSSFPREYHETENMASVASGVMAIEIAHDMSEYILWFKPEMLKTVDWAGQQEKNTTKMEDGTVKISPRKSFAKWTEEVKYMAEEWTNHEISAAMKLREDLIQVINKRASEIRKLNDLLKVAYEELDTFSFTISHDLRTPLSAVKNYTEIILEDHGGEFTPAAKELFYKVIKGTDKMASLIKDVLQYSRVGRTEIQYQVVDMKRLLEEIRDEIINPLNRSDIKFVLKNTPSVAGDRTMLMQLFTNIVGNAVKYSTVPGHTNSPHIEITGELKGDFVEYIVSDNGVGLDMKYASRIFELFRRLDNVKNVDGTGVGLAIVKRIVEKHHGKIWLESRLNHGTKFYISLLAKVPENA